ncbi:hypothetical protein EV195_101314 [Tenacibaculum skagerrakense]|uniref:Uncharacterized protein n=1 Tax=Tenacibaculum skagerrakense TaxID=186571 RepID=A0A4R2P2H4_9FLAO|nr:hypothetical protein [Tenacibaculum skagerrakense]TCP28154.1 hypothetical protein EV195_101314 [Tenacibaculum skagerrakense]
MGKLNINKTESENHFLNSFVANSIDENIELKKRLETNDFYSEFISEKSKKLLDEAIELSNAKDISILEALNIVQDNFKISIANE